MKSERIENAINIIKFAIDNNLSVKSASIEKGYSGTYVKNVKRFVHETRSNGGLDNSQIVEFYNIFDKYKAIRGLSDATLSNDTFSEKPVASTFGGNVGMNKPVSNKTTFNVNGNTAELESVTNSSYPPNHVKTLEGLLAAAKVDCNIWKVKDYIINKWDVTSWKQEKPKTIENWQVKARLEKDVKMSDVVDIEKMFKDMAKTYQPPVLDWSPVTPKKDAENNLLEISIFDLHIGKLAWGGETFENYDTKIARERFIYSIEKLLHRASGFAYSRILFPVGNDFFNSDNIFNTTTKGTQQDEDLRWQKTFNIGVRLLVDGINLLKQTGVPVDVMVIPGNHDFERSYYMGMYLEAWFNNDPMVHINNGASPRKYYRFGNVLLGLTHGSEEKESSLPLLMATDIESKPMWSDTKFHEWHLGHQHRKKNVKYELNRSRELNEDLGVTVRYLSSLTGTEEWHHKKGYVGCNKAADAFIWNDNLGLVAHLNSNIIIN